MKLVSYTVLLMTMACTGETLSTDKTTDSEQNNTPSAEAGIGGVFFSDQPINLDGSNSSDPNGDILTYHWSFSRVPEGSLLLEDTDIFQNNNSENPKTVFFADTAGTYIINLVVTDSTGLSSDPDSVIISVEDGQLPIADAGADQTIIEGETAILTAASSADPLGRDLSYHWAITSTPINSSTATLTDEMSMEASFTPDVGGSYMISLIVNNGINDSLPDSMVVNVELANPLAPTADAGEDLLEEQDCSDIQLDGSNSSDPNDDQLQYLWQLQSKPEDSVASQSSFSDPTAEAPTFYADVAGDYILSLAVFDGIDWSLPDLINITTIDRIANNPPQINAGSNIMMDAGNATCQLAGYDYICNECNSVVLTIGSNASISDPEGDPIIYEWQALSGDISFADAGSLETTATFSGAAPVEPNVCEETVFEVELVAEDCPGAGGNDSFTVTLSCCGVESASH